MNRIVVYDSQFGNTEAIARAIAAGIGGDVRVARVGQAGEFGRFDLLIAGSPTQAGRPTAAVKAWLDALPALEGAEIAAFDTRLPVEEGNFALKLLMRLIGFAGPKIEGALIKKGGQVAAPAAGFIVTGKEGPLREGELQRAEAWGRLLAGMRVAA